MRRAFPALCLAFIPGIASATDWSVEAGTEVVSEPDHLGAASRRRLVLPILAATYGDRLKASIDDGVRWTAFDLGALTVGPVVEYRTSYDRRLPAGFRKIRDAIEPGLFAELATPVGVVEARVRRAITGYGGWSADLAADTEVPVRLPGTIGVEARLAWADRAFGHSRFDVTPRVAAATGLSPYAARAYLAAGVGAQWRLPVTSHVIVTASIGADRMLTNGASPIVRTRAIIQTGLGVSYRFGR